MQMRNRLTSIGPGELEQLARLVQEAEFHANADELWDDIQSLSNTEAVARLGTLDDRLPQKVFQTKSPGSISSSSPALPNIVTATENWGQDIFKEFRSFLGDWTPLR